MSQVYKSLVSGPVPPAVATSYVTQDGTAVPAANILIVNGFDSIENNDNGIITKGGVVGTGTSNEVDVVITNRIKVTATTTNSQTQNVTVMTMTNGTAVEFSASFIGYAALNDEAAGGSQEGVARASAGTAVVVGTNDSLDESDTNLAAVNWNIVASGADLVAQFVGIAGRIITWSAVFTYTQTP